MKSLHELLKRLAEVNVDFVVVGGYAGVLHGSADVTNDLALCVALTPETVQRLRAALRPRAMEITLFGTKCRVLTLEDLITSKEALGRERDLLADKELRAIAAKRRQRVER